MTIDIRQFNHYYQDSLVYDITERKWVHLKLMDERFNIHMQKPNESKTRWEAYFYKCDGKSIPAALKLDPPNSGFVNHANTCAYVFKTPRRQYRKTQTSNNTLVDNLVRIHLPAQIIDSLDVKFGADFNKNIFSRVCFFNEQQEPQTLTQTIEQIKAGSRIAGALSSKFAVSESIEQEDACEIWYKTVIIGKVTKSTPYNIYIQLPYYTQELRDLFNATSQVVRIN